MMVVVVPVVVAVAVAGKLGVKLLEHALERVAVHLQEVVGLLAELHLLLGELQQLHLHRADLLLQLAELLFVLRFGRCSVGWGERGALVRWLRKGRTRTHAHQQQTCTHTCTPTARTWSCSGVRCPGGAIAISASVCAATASRSAFDFSSRNLIVDKTRCSSAGSVVVDSTNCSR